MTKSTAIRRGPTLEQYLDANLGKKHIVGEIMKERERQKEIWGVQHHNGLKWYSIAGEEFGEVAEALNDADEKFAESKIQYDAGRYERALELHREACLKMSDARKETIETIAVLVAFVEDMDGDEKLDPRP